MNNSNYYDNETINKIRLNLGNYLKTENSNEKDLLNLINYAQTGGSCPCEKVLEAFSKSNVDLALYIINEGNCCYMCIDNDGNTVLHNLVNYAFNEDCFSCLLSAINCRGSDNYINMQNYKGQTPMMLAVLNENEDLAVCFENAGAKKDIKDNEGNYIGTNNDQSEVNKTFIKNIVNITLPSKPILNNNDIETDDFIKGVQNEVSGMFSNNEFNTETSDMFQPDSSSLNTEQLRDAMIKRSNLIDSMKREESDFKKQQVHPSVYSDGDLSKIENSDMFFEAIKNKYGSNPTSSSRAITQDLFNNIDEETTPIDLSNTEINRLVNEETSETDMNRNIKHTQNPVKVNLFNSDSKFSDNSDFSLSNSSIIDLSNGTINSELLKKEISKLSALSKIGMTGGGSVTKSYRNLNTDSDSNSNSDMSLQSESGYLSGFEYELEGGGNEISRMLNNKKSQIHQEVIDSIINMLKEGLIKEKSKKLDADERNAKLIKAYIYKKVSEENPQMTGMDKILLIKGMNDDEFVKHLSKMPALDKIEKDIEKHLKSKKKESDSDMTSLMSNSDDSDKSDATDKSKKSKSTTKKTTTKKATTKKAKK